MDKKFLNIGCGNCKLDGFINIDLEPTADMQLDVRNGLPFDDDSVNGIYSEHFIEHLTQSEGIAFLRECRRVLKCDGILRLSTPDLSNSIQRYLNNDWRPKSNLDTYGFEWLNTPCEYLNTAMREWGHKWLYDETELVRLVKYAGFYQVKRCEKGISDSIPLFSKLESRVGDFLIIEARKRKIKKKPDNPLVSIFIPAYNYRYFSNALESALNQSYDNIEIIIGDDSRSEKIKDIVEILKTKYPAKKIHYFREGPPGQGERKNSITCLSKSKGELIKPLDDDDLLEPRCVERMVEYVDRYPSVTLVTSHRQLINSEGRKLPDISATKRIVQEDALINGSAIVKTLVTNCLNFIGEPSTVMFRKEDLIDEYPDILSFAGRKPVMNGDVALWMKLLSRGDCIYIAETLSSFRQHKEQTQQQPGMREKGLLAWKHALFDAKRMGFLSPSVPLLSGRSLSSKSSDTTKVCSASIIIPLFNQLEHTKQCLEALVRNTPDKLYEVIIVDNASTDGTREFLKCLEGDVKIITNKENLGFANACNQGARAASGKYLIFLNNNTVPQPGWLEEMIQVAESDDNIGIVGSKLLFPDGTIQHAGVVISKNKLPYHIYRGSATDIAGANKLRDYHIISAACMLIRCELFFDADCFDERYVDGCEDIDLCLKVGEKGKRVVYTPKSVLIYHEGKTEGREAEMDNNHQLLLSIWKDKIEQDDEKFFLEDGLEKTTTSDGSTHWILAQGDDDKAKISIIIVTYNSLTDIKQCVNSIISSTSFSHELIIVDNSSTDGTQEYLKTLTNAKIIFNQTNNGFSKACNQGIKESKGDYIVLLNPDTAVTRNWDIRMTDHFKEGVGAVGPVSNYVAGLQKLKFYQKEPVVGDILINDLADKLYHWNKGKGVETKLLIGFCLMIKKEVIENIGMLDEDLFLGNDDLEYSWRLRNNGWQLVVATDTFVYHKGQASFKTEKKSKTSNLLQQSSDKLYDKLEKRYGANKIPTTIELWGLSDWFVRPSQVKALLKDSFESNPMLFTGERAMPLAPNMEKQVMLEHWARYNFVVPIVKGKRVLDIACGAGYGSNLLAETAQMVTGGDILHEAITYCKEHYYQKSNLQFEVMDIRELPFGDHTFDFVVSFETLEHIMEGDQLLREICRVLTEDGTLAISTPFGGPCGNPYHVAYYQRESFGEFLTDYFKEVDLKFQREDQFFSSSISPGYAPTFTGEYGLAICHKPKKDFKKLTSIVILTYNQLKYTKKCIKSIFKYTKEPFELIVVDNGSTDDTVKYLESEVSSQKSDVKIQIIKNKENLGFATGNNQGMAAARGDFVLLMNNDLVVTPGWLERLIACAERNAQIGIVGPMSNYVSGPQLVKEVTYDTNSLARLNKFSSAFSKKHAGQIKHFWRVVGFCMLIKRSVIKKIGGLDGRYGLGNFEDDDFSLRAALAGFESWIAQDCFVHHFGSRTFAGAKIDYMESLHKNWEIFKQKWRIPADVVCGAPYDMGSILKDDFIHARHYCPLNRMEYSIKDGEQLFGMGDMAGAQRIFEQTLSTDPSNIEALNNLGVIAFQQGETDKAASFFTRVLESDENYFEAIENLGKCAEVQTDYPKAAEWFERAVKLKPEEISLLNSLGNCFIQIEDFKSARDAYKKSLELDGGQEDIRVILRELEGLEEAKCSRETSMETNQFREEIVQGEEYCQQGKTDQALEIFESLLQREPDNMVVLNDKGVVLNRLGRYEEAIQLFMVALQKEKNNSDAAFNLIANYITIGNWEKAEAALGKYRHCLPANDIDMITNDLRRFRSSDRYMSIARDSKVVELSASSGSHKYTFKISLDLNQFSQKIMWGSLSKGQLYEQGTSNFLASILREGDSFIDIGSHIGYFSLLASVIVGNNGQVFAIEPEPSNFDRLTTNISLNTFSNIKTFNLALGAEVEQKQFFINTDNDGGHALWNVGLHPFNKNSRANPVVKNITTATLDSLFEENDPNSVKLIKIDAEGSESAILQGGANMLSRHNVPYVICEINRFALKQMGTSEEELRGYMELSGYETYLLNDTISYFTRLSKDEYIESDCVFNLVFSKTGNAHVSQQH